MNCILDIVSGNPGIRYSELVNMSGLTHGVISHYLYRMEKTGLVRITRSKRRTFIFSCGTEEALDNAVINMRKETTHKILLFLCSSNPATFREIREACGKSPSTVSISLTRLVETGLIRRVYGIVKKYELLNRDLALQALEKVRPGASDMVKDRFADTFSFL